MNKRSYWLISLLMLFVWGKSQSPATDLLINELKRIEQKYNVVFSYDAKALTSIAIPITNHNSILQALRQLDSLTAFKYNLLDNLNVLIEYKFKEKNLAIFGSISSIDDMPIRDAVISIRSQNLYTVTNANGFFKLYCQLNESDSVKVDFVGYKSQKLALRSLVTNPEVKIQLIEDVINLSGIIINGYITEGINYIEKDQSIKLTPDKLGLLPAETETDLYSSLQALPGINSSDDKAGNLALRGSDPDKVLVSYDNIPIYHRGHYFGTFSPFNTQMLEDVTVQRSGITSVEKGGRVGGYLGMQTKSHIPDSINYNVGLATSYGFINVFAPLVKKKLAVLIGARSSYPFNWHSPKIDAINEFIFYESDIYPAVTGLLDQSVPAFKFNFNDINAKLIYELSQKHKISLSYLKIADKLEFNVLDQPIAKQLSDTAYLNNWGMNLSIQNSWSKNWNTVSNLTQSNYYQDFVGYTFGNRGLREYERFYNSTKNFKVSSTTNYKINNYHHVLMGYEADQVDLKPIHTLIQNPSPQRTIGRPDKQIIQTIFSGYQMESRNKRLNLSTGIRINYYSGTQKFYYEPRMLINYKLNKMYTAKLSSGFYYQFMNIIPGSRVSTISGVSNFNWNLSNNTDIPVVNGRQIMGGLVYSKNKMVVDVETYFKLTDNLTAYNFFLETNDTSFIYGSNQIYGVDLLVKKAWKKIEGWISYSYANNYITFNNQSIESFISQPHIFKVVASYTFKQFKISVGWRYRSGLPAHYGIRNIYTGGQKFMSGSPSTPPNPNINKTFTEDSEPLYTDRFPNSHQLDISANYKFLTKSKRLFYNLGVTIQNVYNNKQIVSQIERPMNNRTIYVRANKYGMGFAPSLILSLNFH